MGNPLKVHASWISEDYFHLSDALSAVTHFRGEVLTPEASHPDAFASSLN